MAIQTQPQSFDLSQEPTIPKEFTSIGSLLASSPRSCRYNVMGTVVDFMPPKPSRGPDWQMSVNVGDLSSQQATIRAKFFCAQHRLPNVHNPGDVIVLRNVKHTAFNGENILLSSFETTFSVLPFSGIPSFQSRHFYLEPGRTVPHHTPSGYPSPSREEEQWAIVLKEKLHNNTTAYLNKSVVLSTPLKEDAPIQPSIPRVAMKFSLIQDIQPDSFYDLVAEVVKIHNGGFNEFAELYVTDYTVNKKLQERTHTADLMDVTDTGGARNGNAERMILKVEVHPPHNHWANANITQGDFILINNIRIKNNRNGRDLEGNLWMDKRYPSKVLLSKPPADDKRIEGLLERRRIVSSYQSSRFNQMARSNSAPKTLKAMKRKRAKEKRRNQGGQHGPDKHTGVFPCIANGSLTINSEKQESGDLQIKNSYSLNPHIKVEFENVRFSSFEDVTHNQHRQVATKVSKIPYQLPFVNCRHRMKLKVVDFYPHHLEEFCVTSKQPSGEWLWSFWLVAVSGDCATASHVQKGQAPAMLVHCYGRDAVDLLRIEHKPQNLQLEQTSKIRHQVAERLWSLWGNLAELKSDFFRMHPKVVADETFSASQHGIYPDNLPFECCIQEIGLPAQGFDMGYARSFRMFGTCII